MRKLWSTILIGFTFVSVLLNAQSLNHEKLRISVIPFEGWRSQYGRTLADKVATGLVESNRFIVIDREHIDKILEEQKFQLLGIVDEVNAVKIGTLAGIDKLLIGKFTKHTVEYHKATYDNKGKKVTDAYYSAEIEVTLKFLDVESGKYLKGVEVESYSSGDNEAEAFQSGLDYITYKILDKIEQFYPIVSYVKSLDKDIAIIDKGRNFGVKKGMNFEILDKKRGEFENRLEEIKTNVEKISTLKITSVEEKAAKGRIIGDFNKVEPGHLVRETQERITLEGTIIKKDGGMVIINLGENISVLPGRTFNAIRRGEEIIDHTTEKSYGYEESIKGIIYITKTYPTYAKGKILKGRYSIQEGMRIKETSRWKSGWNPQFSYMLAKISGETNNNSWAGTVSDKYTGSHEVEVDYSGVLTLSSIVPVYYFSFGKHDLVTNSFQGVGLGIVDFSNKYLSSAFFVDGILNYQIGVIPEIFYFYVGGGVGIAWAWQEAEEGLIAELSDGYSGNISTMGFGFFGQMGVRLRISCLNIYGEFDYRKLDLGGWSYSVKTGEDEKGNDETEGVEIPESLIPYPEVSFGPAFTLGISWEFGF